MSLFVFFRHFFLSGGNLITGDVGDNRFNIFILEHWNAVVHGKASVTSPDFYWPQQYVLGYSDAEMLLAIPYVLLRLVHVDPYWAFEISLMVLKTVGFFAMLWLLRSFVSVPRPVSLVGAVLFTIANSYYLQAGHCQLVSVVFVPLLACLGIQAWKLNEERRTASALLSAGSTGLLLALLLFTSYYIGWFTVFAAVILLLMSILAQQAEPRLSRHLRARLQAWRRDMRLLGVAAAAFCVGIIPFLVTYLPVARQTGGRSFSEVVALCNDPLDILNVGPRNLLWGHALNKYLTRYAHHSLQLGEPAVGWPLLTLTLIAAGVYFGFRTNANHKRLYISLLTTFLIGWALTLRAHNTSLWHLVFTYVPGARAIRAVSRFDIVLTLFAVIIGSLVLTEVLKRSRVAFYLLVTVLVLEQMNKAAGELINRHDELAILARVRPALTDCRSFFLAHPASADRPFYANQIDAMAVARMQNLPTLNGYSGWSPKEWNLNDVDDLDYLANVRRWAVGRNVASHVCALDLRDGSWSRVEFQQPVYRIGAMIDFKHGGNALLYQTDGWGPQEPGGSWTLGSHSELVLKLANSPKSELVLSLAAHPFIARLRPHFEETVLVNGTHLADWLISTPHVDERALIPPELADTGTLRIEFIDHDPKSPADFGYSLDNRQLGLAVETMTIVPARVSSGTWAGLKKSP